MEREIVGPIVRERNKFGDWKAQGRNVEFCQRAWRKLAKFSFRNFLNSLSYDRITDFWGIYARTHVKIYIKNIQSRVLLQCILDETNFLRIYTFIMLVKMDKCMNICSL